MKSKSKRGSASPWWLAEEEDCGYCHQAYARSVEYYCVHCEEPVCPSCVIVIRETREFVCPHCHQQQSTGVQHTRDDSD